MRTRAQIALGVLVLAVSVSQAGAVTLRYKFKSGETHAYKTTMKGRGEMGLGGLAESMRMEMSIEMVTAQKVLSVGDGGHSAQIEQRVKPGGKMVVTFAGNSTPTEIPQERVLLTMDTRGRVLKLTVAGTGGGAVPGASMQGMDWAQMAAAMAFPEKDVKVNEVWETNAAVDVATGAKMKVQARSRLLGLETYKGRQCARIRTSFSIPLDTLLPQMMPQGGPAPEMGGQVTGLVVWYFDHVSGLVIDESGKVTVQSTTSFTMGEQTVETSSSMVMNVKSVLQK